MYRIVLKETGQIEEKENGRGEAIGRGIGTVAIEDDRDQDLENDANALAGMIPTYFITDQKS